jgi:peptidoglycan/LPS O-acetylase OafA/YrhL
VLSPPPNHPRFPLSDGIRGLAAVAVLVVHVWLFTGGFGGFTGSLPNRLVVRLDFVIAVFFALSGFLLYRPMIAHRAGGPAPPKVSGYFRGRFLRIYPAYWVALTALAIFPGLVGVFTSHWWVFYSTGDYFDPNFHLNVCPLHEQFKCGLPQTWTLVVEVTFYLTLPFYWKLAELLTRGRSLRVWVTAELLVLTLVSALSIAVTGGVFGGRGETWFDLTFLGHIPWLVLGMAFAIVSVAVGTRIERFPRALRAVAARPSLCWLVALGLFAITLFYYPAPFPVAPFTSFEAWSIEVLQGLVALAILIPILFGNPNRGAPARITGTRPVIWLGMVSYGLYLWQVTPSTDLGFGSAHEGFLVDLIGTVAFALPLAALSFYLVERPLMRLRYIPFSGWYRTWRARRERQG